MSATRTERVRAIVLLLQHRLDYLDSAIRLGQSFPSKPGAQPTHRVACSCARLYRNSWVGVANCPMCAGSGFRRRYTALDGPTRDKDGNEIPEAFQDERGAIFDPMTYAHDRSVKAGASGGTRTYTREETDRELARLRADKRARAGVHLKTEAYGWEKARERRDRSGSFKELDAALEALGIQHPGLHALLTNVFRGVYGEGRIPPGAGQAYWQAIGFLEQRMPDPIRVPARFTEAENGRRRDESVAETYRRTGSLKQTALAHNMRKLRVKSILGLA